MLKTVRRIQRRVAEAKGLAFWDWSSVMGGPCGSNNREGAVLFPARTRSHAGVDVG
ncbi:MAG: hypothetical protein ACOC91_03375 [bacterium]